MGIFKTRRNKKFNYTPQHYKRNGDGSPFEIKGRFDEYRKTIGPSKGIKGKVTQAWDEFKYEKDQSANKRILIVIAILVLIFLFIIDFDLSIFF
ncbi:MAG: riboflavin synthase subunit beta [Bacteroidetes bacterium MedPE-SWsnd-G2]|nr:MAG: riboflavin synthase subunit beta [Bacteroidetes bacterium MedPE-SWsnd-G2]